MDREFIAKVFEVPVDMLPTNSELLQRLNEQEILEASVAATILRAVEEFERRFCLENYRFLMD
jgi:hypothetical protein